MIITRSAKRLMATVMTMALVVTGLVVAPKQASAAAEAPEVKILGATLRLDETGDSQALRFGVEISNASQAKNCGITLTRTSDSKSVTVQTGVEGQNNIYDYNEDTDKLIYTVVLKGITEEDFDEGLQVTGKVQAIEDEEWTPVESNEEKSVDSVLESINTTLGTNFYFDGATLLEKVDTYDFEGDLSSSFFNNYFSNPGWVGCSKIALSEDAHGGEQAMEINSNAEYGGLPFPDFTSTGEYYLSCYAKKVEGDESDVTVRFKSALGKNCQETLALTDEWQQLQSTYVLDDMISTDQYNNKHSRILVCPIGGAKNYLIDDVTIVKKVNQSQIVNMSVPKSFDVELSAASQASYSSANSIVYENGTLSAFLTGQYGGGGICWLVKPDRSFVNPADYSKIVITFNTDTEDAPLCVNLRHNASTDWWDGSQTAVAYPTASSTVGEDKTVEINLKGNASLQDKLIYAIAIKNNGYGDAKTGFGITVKSIEFIA